MNMKTCSKCGIEKELNEFRIRKIKTMLRRRECSTCLNTKSKVYRQTHLEETKKHNKQYRINNKETLKTYQEIYRKENKQKAIAYSKALYEERMPIIRQLLAQEKFKPCIDCNKMYIAQVMDFDHIDPKEKKFNISVMCGKPYGVANIKNEIDKCELRCANCHRDKTYRSQIRTKPIVSDQIGRRRKIQDQINKIKEVPCLDCKVKYNYWQLDFDHRDASSKIEDISTMIHKGFAINKILLEIEKCDLVCVNCHRIRTFERRKAEKLIF